MTEGTCKGRLICIPESLATRGWHVRGKLLKRMEGILREGAADSTALTPLLSALTVETGWQRMLDGKHAKWSH
jgi:hypothetical protein